MDIRPLESGDIDCLNLEDIDRWVIGELPDMQRWEGYAFTILDDDERPIGVSGFSCVDRVGSGWLIGTKALRECPVYLHRTMKRVLRELLQNPDVDCIYADVEKRSTIAARWLERLGFSPASENTTNTRYVLTAENM